MIRDYLGLQILIFEQHADNGSHFLLNSWDLKKTT